MTQLDHNPISYLSYIVFPLLSGSGCSVVMLYGCGLWQWSVDGPHELLSSCLRGWAVCGLPSGLTMLAVLTGSHTGFFPSSVSNDFCYIPWTHSWLPSKTDVRSPHWELHIWSQGILSLPSITQVPFEKLAVWGVCVGRQLDSGLYRPPRSPREGGAYASRQSWFSRLIFLLFLQGQITDGLWLSLWWTWSYLREELTKRRHKIWKPTGGSSHSSWTKDTVQRKLQISPDSKRLKEQMAICGTY